MNVLLGVAQPRDRHITHFLKTLGLPRGTTTTVMHVVEFPTLMNQITRPRGVEWNRQSLANAHDLIRRVAAPLSGQELEVRSLVKFGRPGPILLDTAERLGVDLTVVSPHRSSRLAKFFLGSVSEMLLGEVSSSVLIVRQSSARHHRELRIVLAMDLSRDAKRAARFLSTFSLPPRSRVTLLHVEETEDTMLDRISRMDRRVPVAIERAKRAKKRHTRLMLDRLSGKLVRRGVTVDTIHVQGVPAVQILRVAGRHRADLIVMGSKGLTGLERYLLGSVSRKVARHAGCSVLVVRKARKAVIRS